jgi:uncharacterized protein
MTAKQELIDKVRILKKRYESRGFLVLGIFGSQARGEATPESDVDILYDLSETFYHQYRGLEAFGELDSIRQSCEKELGRPVDLAGLRNLNEIGKKYILPEVLYV